MGIFSKIKDAIFGDKAKDAPAPTNPFDKDNPPRPDPKVVPVVDVENRLDSMPGADRLNWRTSIVDLMKLINVDSSYENRKALAQELGREDYSGTAEDNIWLHKVTMQHLAHNGGKVPDHFLD